MCGNPTMHRERQMMSFSIVKTVADQLGGWEQKPTVLLHTVGEPTLHSNLSKIISLVNKTGCPINLYTNAFCRDYSWSEELFNSEHNILTVSIGLIQKASANGRLMTAHKLLSKVKALNSSQIRIRGIKDSDNRPSFEILELINTHNAQLELTIEGNQGGKNPRKVACNPGTHSNVCCLPFKTLVVDVNGHLGYCVIDFEAELVSTMSVQDDLLKFWNGEYMAQIQHNHKSENLEGTICAFCSCRHELWRDFNSIYRK